MDKNVLVTGSAGFIGFHLTTRLLKEGYNVVGIDNINDYYDVRLKYARLEECGISEPDISDNIPLQSSRFDNYTFYKCDLSDEDFINALFKEHNFSRVINSNV